jgi:hypothetical protein
MVEDRTKMEEKSFIDVLHRHSKQYCDVSLPNAAHYIGTDCSLDIRSHSATTVDQLSCRLEMLHEI